MHQEKTELWERYEAGMAYQRSMGFAENFPKYVRFREGDQWAPATARTKNLPRPVFNIVELFIRTKRAAIINQSVSMTFTPTGAAAAENSVQAERLAGNMTEYARLLWKRLDQDRLNLELLDDAATLGTGILHYYFDDTVRVPGSRPCIGEIRGESIDPLQIFFADPQCTEVQKQEYVLIASRRRVEELRQDALHRGLSSQEAARITADYEDRADYGREPRSAGENYCTVLTRYYRRDGKVYFDRATRTVELVRGQSLTPSGGNPITLYPVVVFPWKRRKKCIFGIGEAEEILPNQKAINFNLAMMLLSVQQTAWPKLLSTPGAIRQPVTNEPGEHLIDYSAGGGGIRYLSPPEFSGMALGLSNTILDLSRTVSGVTNIVTGELPRGEWAAAAVIAMQNQARTPIQETQRRFWDAVRQVGSIWLQLIGAYYSVARPLARREGEQWKTVLFCGNCCRESELELNINVGASSEFGEALSTATLDRFLSQGFITPEQYVELVPDNVAPFRERLRQMWAEAREQEALQ